VQENLGALTVDPMRLALEQYPDLHGVLIDLPEVVVEASELETSKFADRCEVVGGNALSAVPTSGDIYMIKGVIMSLSDDDAGKILSNCRAAMRPDGKVLVIDPMLPDGSKPHYNRLTDLLMLVVPGGRCRSEAEFRRLFDAAGVRPCGARGFRRPWLMRSCINVSGF
jgi:O-methyltransferase domain